MKAKRRRLQGSKPLHTELHRYELLSIQNQGPKKVGIKAFTTDVYSEGQAAHVFKRRYNAVLPKRQKLESWAFVQMIVKDLGPVSRLTVETQAPPSPQPASDIQAQIELPFPKAFCYH
jgi:hypothetical protein